jgi:CBS domain-containing protein
MKTNVECVTPQDSVETAAQVMRARNIGFLPVCDEKTDRVVGTVTDRDIAIRVVAEHKSASTRVASIMTRDAVVCRPEDDLATAEELMTENLVSRIMCVDEQDELVGVISLSDLAQFDGESAIRTLEQVSAREATVYTPVAVTQPTRNR